MKDGLMARPRRVTNSLESLSPAAAKSALLRLIAEGRVTAAEVTRSVMEEVESLRERLDGLLGSGAAAIGLGRPTRGRGRKLASAAPKTSTTSPRKRRRPQKVSAERRSAMARQGRFLSALRSMPSANAREAFKKKYKEAKSTAEKDKLIRGAAQK
jgi:hypothetical protein